MFRQHYSVSDIYCAACLFSLLDSSIVLLMQKVDLWAHIFRCWACVSRDQCRLIIQCSCTLSQLFRRYDRGLIGVLLVADTASCVSCCSLIIQRFKVYVAQPLPISSDLSHKTYRLQYFSPIPVSKTSSTKQPCQKYKMLKSNLLLPLLLGLIETSSIVEKQLDYCH